MNLKIGGVRKRPRVALLGEFSPEVLERFREVFPTLWETGIIFSVHPNEIDVLIIGRGVKKLIGLDDYIEKTNVICFSRNTNLILPGVNDNTAVHINGITISEEHILPPVSLSLNKVRDAELAFENSTKKWNKLGIFSTDPFSGDLSLNGAEDRFMKGAIVLDRHDNLPLSVIYKNKNNGLGYAWFPNSTQFQYEWTVAVISEWSKETPDMFPGFGDWETHQEWMTTEEEFLAKEIIKLEIEKNNLIKSIDEQIAKTTKELETAKLVAKSGKRRLLVEQGDELVSEVANVFRELGFSVDKRDENVKPGEPKLEDLRLSIIENNKVSWEAIVEVRGYSRSGFTPSDLQRIGRFANFYLKEKGKLPNKRIYIVNGQIDLSPPFRDRPFASAPDELETFSEDDGLVIWTVELFKALKKINGSNKEALRISIMKSKGYWAFSE